MEVRDVTWSTFDQQKLWSIPKEKQKSFACFGIRIVENGGNSLGAIQGMKMWQSTGTTTSIGNQCRKNLNRIIVSDKSAYTLFFIRTEFTSKGGSRRREKIVKSC